MIALNSPLKPDLKKLQKYLEKVNDNGWYTNFGPLHDELTDRLQEYLGVKNLLLVNNGTSALQVAAKTLGTKSIITTPFSFVATTSAFKWQKDEVAFCDIERDSYNLCPKSVMNAYDSGCYADTVVATHVYGNPCNVDEFELISRRKNVKIIYDAAHAFGIDIKGKSVLNYGDASTLSFHATKVFHTVEGGAIIFKSDNDLRKAKEIINFGINSSGTYSEVGINAKLNEYQAAVGLVNLDVMDDILDYRRNLFEFYYKELKDVVEIPTWHSNANKNGAYMPVKLNSIELLREMMDVLAQNGVQTRNYFYPSLDKAFTEIKSFGCTNSNAIAERILCLPMHANLSIPELQSIIQIVKKTIRRT